MNIMKIQGIKRVGCKRFEYSYSVEGEWKRYFETSNPLWAEYSKDVSQVPDSIAVLPLVGNFIVLASLMNAEIHVDEIDRDFYECVEKFLEGFETVMPSHVQFKKKNLIYANKIVDNQMVEEEAEENLLFFSGGVDATSSLISHIAEKPALVTIWGADIPWNQEDNWKQAIQFNKEVAEHNKLQLLTIHSNFRHTYNDDLINDFTVQLLNDWWWPAFHHSVSMMSMAAPLANGRRKKLYFGSSYSSKDSKDWGSYVLASDPAIDNNVRFCGCQVVHDGYEFSRFDKIERICKYYEKKETKPFLRVCYHANTGKNCGHCEKCSLSIMAIKLSGSDPHDFGFEYQEEEFPQNFALGVMEKIQNKRKYSFMSQYKDVQTALRNTYKVQEISPLLHTFYEAELDGLYDFINASGAACVKKENNDLDLKIQEVQNEFAEKLEVINNEHQMEKESLQKQVNVCTEELTSMKQENDVLKDQIYKMEHSKSWKITKPIRAFSSLLKK